MRCRRKSTGSAIFRKLLSIRKDERDERDSPSTYRGSSTDHCCCAMSHFGHQILLTTFFSGDSPTKAMQREIRLNDVARARMLAVNTNEIAMQLLHCFSQCASTRETTQEPNYNLTTNKKLRGLKKTASAALVGNQLMRTAHVRRRFSDRRNSNDVKRRADCLAKTCNCVTSAVGNHRQRSAWSSSYAHSVARAAPPHRSDGRHAGGGSRRVT